MKNSKAKHMDSAFLGYRSFYTPLNTIKKFADAEYDTICLFPAHTVNSRGTPYSQYPPTWLWFDRIDFTPFNNMVHDVLKAMPDAKFLCMIDLNSPAWLEHINCFSTCDSFNNLGKAIHNPEWREPTKKYLEAFIEYTESRYFDRIKAYVICSGATDEWYDYSDGTEDRDRAKAWREWSIARGKQDPIDIPPLSRRSRCSHDDFLRDPVEDSVAIDYWKFCNESVADTIIELASAARSKIAKSNAQVGCFYGYILEKTYRTLVTCGHLEYEKVLASGMVDFLISPGTYVDREIGGASGFLIPNGTAEVYGKKLLHECDQRTHTYNPYLTSDITLRLDSAWKNESETLAGLKREAALAITKRTHLWWFDMWGDYYQGEAVMSTLARIRELWTRFGSTPSARSCEIALIVDPESTYYINQDHPFVVEMNPGTCAKLARVGAPFDCYSIRDIPRIKNFDRYKFLVFNSTFEVTSEKLRILEQYVFRGGRHVLWLHAPGIVRDSKYDPANCETLTGIPYKTPGLAQSDMDDWNSNYIYDYKEVTTELLRSLARDASIHLYTDKLIPVYADGNLLAFHSEYGGELTVKLPSRSNIGCAAELFTDAVYPVTDNEFTCNLRKPDTVFFKLE